VLSARRFLSKDQRLIPRHDNRKEQLKIDIRKTLETVSDLNGFQKQMQNLGYKVLKGRGISFVDDKKVKIKGSEVGFSLATIEKILHLKHRLKIEHSKLDERETAETSTKHKSVLIPKHSKSDSERSPVRQMEKELTGLLYQLFKPEHAEQQVDQELLEESKKKKYRHKIRH
jgi:hypothetical protein